MVGSPFRDNVITSYISGASVVNCVISAYIHDRVMLERDENGLKRSGNFSLAPHLRGEGRGEGTLRKFRLAESPPHPDRSGRCGACHRARVRATRWHRRGDPTSPRKRGEVTRTRACADST